MSSCCLRGLTFAICIAQSPCPLPSTVSEVFNYWRPSWFFSSLVTCSDRSTRFNVGIRFTGCLLLSCVDQAAPWCCYRISHPWCWLLFHECCIQGGIFVLLIFASKDGADTLLAGNHFPSSAHPPPTRRCLTQSPSCFCLSSPSSLLNPLFRPGPGSLLCGRPKEV